MALNLRYVGSTQEKRKGTEIMRFEISMLTGLISVGAALLARMQVQGIEAGLISLTAEYGLRAARAASTFIRAR
jgi:hypothetical protein